MTHKEFRAFQNTMDMAGLLTTIKTIRQGWRDVVRLVPGYHPEVGDYFKQVTERKPVYHYEVIVNGEIVEVYKARRSAKNYLLRIYNAKLNEMPANDIPPVVGVIQ